ncbi:MAG TPA: flavoprotein, partial [Actinomycetes bacterium]|nr:flavoprotein [Actinomycetes bacterium]
MAEPGAPRAILAGVRVLLGVTGGIAAYKAAELARELMRAGAEVQPLLTESGERMVSRATFAALTGRRVPASVWDDPAGVEHVALARWGQVLVVAPATAHTLARLAAGLADDLLTNVALAFGGPVVVAPAMHTEMWEHPATRASLQTLEGRGVLIVPPASGPLTSGDVGPGRLAELEDLVAGVAGALAACAPTGTPASQGNQGAADNRPVTLELWHDWGTTGGGGLAMLDQIEEYTRAKPHVTINNTPDANRQKFITALASDTVPDLFKLNAPEVIEFGEQNALLALDDLVKRDKWDLKQYFDF